MFVAARECHAPKFLAGLHITTNAPVAAVLLQVGLGWATFKTLLLTGQKKYMLPLPTANHP